MIPSERALACTMLGRPLMVTTAFGPAKIVEEVMLKQSVEGKSFATLLQLLERDDGEPLVRLAYSTDGVARRGPVTLRMSDMRRLAKLLAKTERLRAAIAGAA